MSDPRAFSTVLILLIGLVAAATVGVAILVDAYKNRRRLRVRRTPAGILSTK